MLLADTITLIKTVQSLSRILNGIDLAADEATYDALTVLRNDPEVCSLMGIDMVDDKFPTILDLSAIVLPGIIYEQRQSTSVGTLKIVVWVSVDGQDRRRDYVLRLGEDRDLFQRRVIQSVLCLYYAGSDADWEKIK